MSDENISPLISIVIPCFNHEEFVGETIESVIGQSYKNWECIIVDNGSMDRSGEIIKSVTQNDSRFRYILQENKGVSSARNKAIRMSNGKFILPLDSDDRIGKDYLKEAIQAFEKYPNVKLVYCEAELFGEASGKWNLPEFSMQTMLVENCIFCSALYRRSDYDLTAGYNEAMLTGFEDWDFWLSLLNDGGVVYKIPKVHFYYRIRKSSRNNSLDFEKQLALRKIIFKNHKSLYIEGDQIPEILFKYYNLLQEQKSFENSRSYKYVKRIRGFIQRLRSK